MIASFIMTTARARRRAPKGWPIASARGLLGSLLAGTAIAGVLAAPPAPSTGAPHPSAPVVKFSGMTLEIRSGRVVVTEVEKGSPPDRAGVRPLDVVLVLNDRSLVDLDPISPQHVLALLRQEKTPRTRMILGRGAGTLSVDLPGDSGRPPETAPPSELQPGDEAPPFRGRDLDGKEFSLKDLRGSLVLIDFWASWCHPCEQAVIPIRRLAEQYRGKLRIVGVSLDEDRKAFEAFVYNHHLPGIQLFDGEGWRGTIAKLYGVPDSGIPHYVLVDREGRIAATGTLETIEETIARQAGVTPPIDRSGTPATNPGTRLP